MRLIVQADDYAMTDAVAEGILKCAREGILTQTGLMTNGPHAEYYVKRMMTENPHINFIQEINLVSGMPLSNPRDIPSLVDRDGKLIKSVVHREIDCTDPNHVRYEDAYREIEKQIEKFIQLVGHKPYFIGLHSYQNKTMLQALGELEQKYEISDSILSMNRILSHKPQMGPWYPLLSSYDNPTDYNYQLSFNAIEMFMNGSCSYITDHCNEREAICMLHTHAGFVDKELLDISTLTMTRLIELDLLCSETIKQWIADKKIELTNFNELKKEGIL